MADPQHEPELDDFDRATVRAYRTGLALVALGVFGAGVALLASRFLDDRLLGLSEAWVDVWWVVVVYGMAIAIACMHLYARTIRLVIRGAAWIGVVLLFTSTVVEIEAGAHWVRHAGLGFAFVAISGFALKEQYCFKLPLLRAVPVLLAGSLIPLVGGWPLPAGILLGLAGLILVAMAIQKARMPLHYDIGDKSKYEL